MNYKKSKTVKKRRISKKEKLKERKAKRRALIVGIVVFAAFLTLFFCFSTKKEIVLTSRPEDIAIKNYGAQVIELGREFDINPSYLLSLIMLECSGKKNVPPRFEKGVYNKLKDVKAKKKSDLEGISYRDLLSADDSALKNLASSWGPFQLMGYKCIHLNVKIKDLRGSKSLFWGVYWINGTYGDYIRKGRYADAFHIHNTGHPVPKSGKYQTYDKEYIPNGLKYIEYFETKLK